MLHADLNLARRLESLICAEFRGLARVALRSLPAAGAECLDLAGGVALWLGEGSPVNQAAGQGMNGPVSDTDIDAVEAFYHGRGADAVISVCPLADPSLGESLGRRGWRATEFEHLLVLPLDGAALDGAARGAAPAAGATRDRAAAPDRDAAPSGAGAPGTAAPGEGPGPHLEVRVCTPEERAVWARVAARGFSEDKVVAPRHEEFGVLMAAREDAILVLAWVDGTPAGTGALVVSGGVGWLSGDSTLPQFRGRGIQQAVQRARLRMAAEAGCDLAVTEAAPGGASQRNMERLGFRIAYTHTVFTKPAGLRS